MLIRHASDLKPSEITPQAVYLDRRRFIAAASGAALASAVPGLADAAPLSAAKSPLSTSEPMTSLEDITSYNNFYEFGTDKADPAAYAGKLTTAPWTVKVDGLVGKPADYALEDFVKPIALEERIYRMRCVEGWSMVIPWIGFPLADRAQARRAARQRQVRRVRDARCGRRRCRGRTRFFPVLEWPYVEGPAARRGHASAGDPRRRPLWRDASQPERRADSPRRAVEVRLQGHQVDRADHA